MDWRRFTFWLLLVLFVAFIVTSFFWFPYDRTRLYRVVPESAIFISEHRELARRWQKIAENPLILAALQSAGVPENALAGLAGNEAVRRLVERLVPRHTIVAYAAFVGRRAESGWILASWLGSVSQWRKLELTLRLIPGFKAIRLEAGRKAWLLDAGTAGGGQQWFSMAVVEGMLVGCLSADPHAIGELVERIDSRAPIVRELAGAADFPGTAGSVADRGWLRVTASSGSGRLAPALSVRWELAELDADGVGGHAWLPADMLMPLTGLSADQAELSDDKLRELETLLTGAATVLLAGSYASVKSFFDNTPLNAPWMRAVLAAVLQTNVPQNAPFFICLARPEYTGSLAGLKVPTFFAGVQIASAGDAGAMIERGLDVLNARFRMGLIARVESATNRDIVTVDSVLPGVYKQLAPEEQPAFAKFNDWLIFSSNQRALLQLLAPTALEAERSGTDRRVSEKAAKRQIAFLSVDLAEAEKALDRAAAVYQLLNYMAGSPDQGRNSGCLRITRAWLRALEPLKILRAVASSDGNELNIVFALGRAKLAEEGTWYPGCAVAAHGEDGD